VKAFYSDTFDLRLPAGHRFPAAKYGRLRRRVASNAALLRIELREAEAAALDQLELVHTPDYVIRLRSGRLSALEQRRIGFPWSPHLVERSRRSTGGTILAARAALTDGKAVHLAGGTHHAFPDGGQGFCVFNDVAVAVRVLQAERLARRVVIIDCDVHQGNGTASIFGGDTNVFTFSMHGGRNFPFRKCAGDLDVALPDRTGDGAYLERLRESLLRRLPLPAADIAFYLAGADPYAKDRLGRLKLTRKGLALRDAMVIDACRQLDLPLVIVMAGGYADDIDQIVAIHAATVEIAARAGSVALTS